MPQQQIPQVPTYTANTVKSFIVPVAPGRFPLENEDLTNLQESPFTVIREMLGSVGNYFVLSGVAVTAQDANASTCTVSPGYVYLGGVIRFFPGYTGSYPFFIVSDADVKTQKTFEDGNINDVYVQRFAKAATSPGVGQAINCNPVADYRYQDMVISRSTDAISTLNTSVAALQNEVRVPVGGIIMWGSTTIPTGWALCDGQTGRPDLRGRFVVGYDPNDPDYNSVGQKGGEKAHILNIDEMPSHNHANGSFNQLLQVSTGGDNTGDTYDTSPGELNSLHGATIASQGNNAAHENRPPYYTLCYIIRVA